jgi:hypothetical protein
MLWRHKRAAGVLLAIIAGSIFGLANYALADPECEELTFVEGVGAQDTNGDGLATIAEGLADINGDGKFTCVEAQHFGMNCFICWGPANCPPQGEVIDTLPNKVCQESCITGKRACVHMWDYNCKRTATGCN